MANIIPKLIRDAQKQQVAERIDNMTAEEHKALARLALYDITREQMAGRVDVSFEAALNIAVLKFREGRFT